MTRAGVARGLLAALALLAVPADAAAAESVTSSFHAATSASTTPSAPTRRRVAAPLPAANFLVEWRL
ncbi:MAG: hypothetical protein ABJD97_06780 [Betaproteobacteria bacterium]